MPLSVPLPLCRDSSWFGGRTHLHEPRLERIPSPCVCSHPLVARLLDSDSNSVQHQQHASTANHCKRATYELLLQSCCFDLWCCVKIAQPMLAQYTDAESHTSHAPVQPAQRYAKQLGLRLVHTIVSLAYVLVSQSCAGWCCDWHCCVIVRHCCRCRVCACGRIKCARRSRVCG